MRFEVEPKVLSTVTGKDWIVDLVDLAKSVLVLYLVLFERTLIPDEQILVEGVSLAFG